MALSKFLFLSALFVCLAAPLAPSQFYASAAPASDSGAPGADAVSKLGRALSGTYVGVSPSSGDARAGACPEGLEVQAVVAGSTVEIPLPYGLRDPSGKCYVTAAGQGKRVFLADGAAATTARFLTGAVVKQTATLPRALMQPLPEGAFRCAGDRAAPFESISVTPLNRYIVPLLVQHLKAAGLAGANIAQVFSTGASAQASVWATERGALARKHIMDALAYLGADFVLSLNRAESDVQETGEQERVSRSCVLRGGALSAAETEENMEKFVTSLHSILSDIGVPLPIMQSEVFWPSNSKCELNPADMSKSALAILRKVDGRSSRKYGLSPLYSARLAGEDCAELELYRYPEVVKQLVLTESGRELKALGSKLFEFMVERAQQSVSATSSPTFRAYFPGFSARLRKLGVLTDMFVGHLSFQGCRTPRPDIDFLLVRKPLTLFYCHGFVPSSTPLQSACKGAPLESLYNMGGSHTEKKEDELSVAQAVQSVFGSITDYSVFMPRHSNCIYSSSPSMAQRFRAAFSAASEMGQ